MSEFEPKIILFYCQFCPDKGINSACSADFRMPSNIKRIRIPCAGSVDILHLMHALEAGADGAFVLACMEGDCHNETGNVKAQKRVDYVKKLLEDLGLEPDRVGIYYLNSSQGPGLKNIAKEILDKIKELGPSPLAVSEAA
ncbi:MAG TPA: hydrogenase iron-sulfur subunit [Deltaproteobacteria bacterium]|nr:hydrogenase iron-sulfur subunit [Deltaproteobacteria bacterium]